MFTQKIYDNTIGLFIGPSILAMDGKIHREHRNLVSAAFKTRSLARWEPEIVRPVVNTLIDEFIETGNADLVRRLHLRVPHPRHPKLLGLPEDDLPLFRTRAVALISYHVKWKKAFEASAELKDYFIKQIDLRRSGPDRGHHRRSGSAEIDGEKLTDEAIYSFLRLLLPAGLETTYRSSSNLLYLLLTNPDQFAAMQADRELIGPAIEEGLRFETPLTTVQRFAGRNVSTESRSRKGAVIDVGDRLGEPGRSRWRRGGFRHLPQARAAHIVRRR